VATGFEEVLLHPYTLALQHIGKDPAQNLFFHIPRARQFRSPAARRLRQRLAIDFSVGVSGRVSSFTITVGTMYSGSRPPQPLGQFFRVTPSATTT